MHNRELEISAGRGVTVTISEAEERTLKWWVENGKQAHIVEACRAELAFRSGNPVHVVPVTTAMAQVDKLQILELCGALQNAKRATETLARIQEIGHLIAPAPVVGSLPEGCSIMVSAVQANVVRETYPIAGSNERGLSKVLLDKLAASLGVQWDPTHTRRLDDCSDPWYCRYQAAGRVRNYDLSWSYIVDAKELDLRDGAPITE